MKISALRIGIVAVVVIAMIYTLGNRRWWWHRINKRWNYFETFSDEFGDDGIRTVNVPESPSIPELIVAYFNGRDGWTKKDAG